MIISIDNIKLRGKFILLRPTEITTQTKSGIFIPSTTETHYKAGTVLKISDAVEKGIYTEGQTVYYNSMLADEISLPTKEGFESLIMAKDEIDIHMIL